MLKSYKYRIYPNKEQIQKMNNHFGCVRYVYNQGLDEKTKAYQKTGKSPSCFDLTNFMLKKEKEENIWLKDVYSQCLQMSLRNLDNAFNAFFRKQNRFPKFKSKNNGHQSFQYPQNVKVLFEENKIKLPKIGKVKAKLYREFNGKIGTVTVSKTPTNKYFVSVLVDDGKETPVKPKKLTKKTTVGIDLGIKDFCILSNGEKIENQKHLKKSINRLKVLQRRKDKKKKGGVNRKKANFKLAKLHEKITNQRNDFLHKISSKIIDENQAICIEDLNTKGMMKNHCLAQSIADVGWGRFVEFLKYKSEWKGKNLIQIGRFDPSTKTCSVCGEINKDLTLKDREWKCVCGKEHDRDINAAKNIKNFGMIKFRKYIGLGRPGKLTEMSGVKQNR